MFLNLRYYKNITYNLGNVNAVSKLHFGKLPVASIGKAECAKRGK